MIGDVWRDSGYYHALKFEQFNFQHNKNPMLLVLPCEVATMPEGAFYGQEGEVARAQRVTEGSCGIQLSNQCRTTPRRNVWSRSSQTYSKDCFTCGDPLLTQGVTLKRYYQVSRNPHQFFALPSNPSRFNP